MKGRGIAIVALVIALIGVIFMWQRDQESKDLNLDVDVGAATPVVESVWA